MQGARNTAKEPRTTTRTRLANIRTRVANAFRQTVTRLCAEIRTPRFIGASVVALVWLVVLCGFGLAVGSGRQNTLADQDFEPFQLPTAQDAQVILPTELGGTLEPAAGFEGYPYTRSEGRHWFNLFLPANHVPGLTVDAPVGLENIRLLAQDGSLLCAPEVELKLSADPSSIGIKADLDLSQQSTNYWRPSVAGYRLKVRWDRRFQGCPYEQPASVLADVAQRQTTATEPHQLELTAAPSKLQAGSSSMTAKPGALPGEWWVEIVNSGQQRWQFAVAEPPAHQGWSIKPRTLPSPGPITENYQLRFNAAAPAELPITLLHTEEERIADVRFSTERDQRTRSSIPPTWHLPLRHTDTDLTLDLPMHAQGREYHELFLPIAMSYACELQVVGADLPLQWRPVERLFVYSSARYEDFEDYQQRRLSAEPYSRYAQLPEEYLGRVRWELQSTDGEQRFFHDLEVTSELRCPAGVTWQPLTYQQSELPWLVPLEAMPEPSVDLAQPAREFFGRFRFLDANGEALMPMARAADLTDPALESFVFPEGQLKFHGEVARIEQLQIDDSTAHSQRWTYRFMSLEAY
ncbi:hypothetical protein EKK97_04625 [Billgrantia tianxiuensis]|uniref:Uncharacterized protein n=1 Tax=Billgrantia tianxiuensis TaxID=2497861 RepID=A0A6I6SEJ6_9GAMM|nr:MULTISPECIES: hypothetical protein [Halomonas]MCE8033306.1 hypothetical protein [Halomonas sp. MCCC 1A11057]QHC49038.1 hypothetical protein EKK97_04625 [Halomonas tianxiuensis]